MDRHGVALGQPVEAHEVDRVALEHVWARDGDAIDLDGEAIGAEFFCAGRFSAPMKRSSIARGLACFSSSAAQTMAVRSPTSLATRK